MKRKALCFIQVWMPCVTYLHCVSFWPGRGCAFLLWSVALCRGTANPLLTAAISHLLISITLGRRVFRSLALKASFGRWFGYIFHCITCNRCRMQQEQPQCRCETGRDFSWLLSVECTIRLIIPWQFLCFLMNSASSSFLSISSLLFSSSSPSWRPKMNLINDYQVMLFKEVNSRES